MSAGGADPETITVLVDAQRRALTKSYRRLGQDISKGTYPLSVEFRAVVLEVAGVDGLAEMLDAVVTHGLGAVIRGAPGKFYPKNGNTVFRLLYPQEGLASAKTGHRISREKIREYNLQPDGENYLAVVWLPMFEDRPNRWVIFDIDRIPVPEHMAADWVDEPDAAVEHVLELLPEPFRLATCWWSISSSAAVPGANGREVSPVFKLKLAFWLDRPLTGAELKRWMAAEGAPVDPAVFGAVQLIYVAPPIFQPPLNDPVPRRTGLRRGEDDLVVVPDILPEATHVDYAREGRHVDYAPEAAAFGPPVGLEDLCAALRARLADEVHVREHLLQAAHAYVRQHGGNINQATLVAALEGVAREHRSHAEVAGYGVDRMVDHVVQRERAATWMPFGRPRPQAILPPYFGSEGANFFAVINEQRRFLRAWIRRAHLFAVARHEIAARRQVAFAAEGLS